MKDRIVAEDPNSAAEQISNDRGVCSGGRRESRRQAAEGRSPRQFAGKVSKRYKRNLTTPLPRCSSVKSTWPRPEKSPAPTSDAFDSHSGLTDSVADIRMEDSVQTETGSSRTTLVMASHKSHWRPKRPAIPTDNMARVFKSLHGIHKTDKHVNRRPSEAELCKASLTMATAKTETSHDFVHDQESIDKVNKVVNVLQSWSDGLGNQVPFVRAVDDAQAALGCLLDGDYLGQWKARRVRVGGAMARSENTRWRQRCDTYRYFRKRQIIELLTRVDVWLRMSSQERAVCADMTFDQRLRSVECQLLEDTAAGLKILMRHLDELMPWKH